METKKKRRPVLAGDLSPDGRSIRVWCPYCRKRHIHGAGRDEQDGKMTHRAAHCERIESPFFGDGYLVVDLAARAWRRKNNSKGKEIRNGKSNFRRRKDQT